MRSLLCLLIGDGDVAGRVHSDWQGRAFELLQGLLEELGEGREMRRRSADDREHQRESVMRGADDRLGAADADPGREGSGFGVRHHHERAAAVATVNRSRRLPPRGRPRADENHEAELAALEADLQDLYRP